MNWDNSNDPLVRRIRMISKGPQPQAGYNWSRGGFLDAMRGYDEWSDPMYRAWMDNLVYDPNTYEIIDDTASVKAMAEITELARQQIEQAVVDGTARFGNTERAGEETVREEPEPGVMDGTVISFPSFSGEGSGDPTPPSVA